MKRVLVLVEGQSEETFIRTVLNPHLEVRDVYLTPTLIRTKRVKSRPDFKGGITSYGQIRGDLLRLLHDSNATTVTTMIDFYGLPKDFPGLRTMPLGDAASRVEHLETCLGADIDSGRFLPYISLHEFEALVFAALDHCGWVFDDDEVLEALRAQRAKFVNAELVNEGAETSPSKRLRKAFPAYKKTLQGPLAIEAAGLDKLRAHCPRFSRWVAALECS